MTEKPDVRDAHRIALWGRGASITTRPATDREINAIRRLIKRAIIHTRRPKNTAS